jgi:hypothetical protein
MMTFLKEEEGSGSLPLAAGEARAAWARLQEPDKVHLFRGFA